MRLQTGRRIRKSMTQEGISDGYYNMNEADDDTHVGDCDGDTTGQTVALRRRAEHDGK